MKTLTSRLFVAAAALAAVAVTPTAQGRTWDLRSGESLEADFVDLDNDMVILKKTDGAQAILQLDHFRPEDQQWIADEMRISLPAAEPVQAEPESEPAQVELPAAIRNLFGDALVNRNKDSVDVANLAGKKIGIYFSAHWCPPCRQFTPLLVQTYNKLQSDGKPFEIVFVSGDRNEKAMFGYMTEMQMPWLAVPFGSKESQKLSQNFGVRSIPTLIIVDETGKTVTRDGRTDVAQQGVKAFEKW